MLSMLFTPFGLLGQGLLRSADTILPSCADCWGRSKTSVEKSPERQLDQWRGGTSVDRKIGQIVDHSRELEERFRGALLSLSKFAAGLLLLPTRRSSLGDASP